MSKMTKDFSEMTIQEIEKFEQQTNSIVFFYNEKAIAFQKIEDNGIAIMIDKCTSENLIVLADAQVNRLKEYFNS